MSSFIDHPKIRKNKVQTRIYQQILFANAVKKNSLIILPTGLGKTIIMVMLTAHFIQNNPQEKVILIAPTRPLVDQHYETFKAMLELEDKDIVILSGSTSPNDRKSLWNISKVIITTPQTIRNDVVSKICDLSKVSLICFDEAHRAVGDDPYVLPAQQYNKIKKNGRIVGFTASPGSKEKIYEIIKNLCIENIEYKDDDDSQVKPYIHGSDEEWIWIDMPTEFNHVLSLLNNYTQENLKKLREIDIIDSIQIKNNPKKNIIGLPAKLNNKRVTLGDTHYFNGMKAYGQLMITMQAIELLETQGINTLYSFFDTKRDQLRRTNKNSLKRFLNNKDINEAFILTKKLISDGFTHPKLQEIKQMISEQVDKNKESRILVFSSFKATTDFLVKELNELKNVKAHRFVGQATTHYGKGLSQKEQKFIMDEFKDGTYNVLVSTSVGEEGLDVAQCDLVIFYDVTPSSTRLIQRSGRTGRSRRGKVVIYITKNTRDEGYFYSSQKKKKQMKTIVQEVLDEMDQKKKDSSDLMDNFFDQNKTNKRIEEDKEINSNKKIEQDKPIIFIDHREKGSDILKELLNQNISLVQDNLPIGDYVLSDRVGVERKIISDFCQTLIRNELFDQLKRLKDAYTKPILIIEGENLYSCSLSPQAIRGAIVSISVDFNIPIIRSKDAADTVAILYTIAKREQTDIKRKPRIKTTSASPRIEDEQIKLISNLPSIDSILAERLLKEFKTPRKLFTSHPDELRQVYGIGLTKANKIDLILSTPFDDEENEP